MKSMFYNCISLTSIDISHFDTSLVKDMSYLFYNCELISSINLSTFNTTQVEYINNIFDGCTSLKLINFSNFDASNVKNMDDMFLNCDNLEFVDLENYKPNNSLQNYYLFEGSSKNLVFCIKNAELADNIILNNECNVVNCLGNWNEFRKKINTENGSCTNDCYLTNYKYEYNYKCYPKCSNGTYNNNYKCEKCHPECRECDGPGNNNCMSCTENDKFLNLGKCVDKCLRGFYYDNNKYQNICICELNQCYICTKESFKNDLCTSCDINNNYYPIYNNDSNINFPYFNCYKHFEGYYLDNESLSFKLCYSSCKSCEMSGNERQHNCLECKQNYKIQTNYGLYKNCYINCLNYFYYNITKNALYCT